MFSYDVAFSSTIGRGKITAAPCALQLDGYRQRRVRTWRPCRNRSPLQRLAIALVRLTLRLRGRRPLAA